MTGDLGKIGLKILIAMFAQSGVKKKIYQDSVMPGLNFTEKIQHFWQERVGQVVLQQYIAAI